jgi:hypothetical protein
LGCENVKEDKRGVRVAAPCELWKWVKVLECLICARVREGELSGSWSVLGSGLYIYILSNPKFKFVLNFFPLL